MAKVYVSSTFLDLQDCRAKVNLALRRVGHEDVAMEYYVAGDARPVEKCLADVAACDLYVGLFAWRYGYVPQENNPDRLSITEMEYRQARKLGKHCLIFLLSEEAPWPRKLMDKDATQIEGLRAELSARHTVGAFTSANDIGDAVYPAVYKWSEEHGQLPQRVSIPDLDLTGYIAALARRYQHLDLDALTPPQRDENLRQRLREIFVEQSVRENPPPVELPKEVLAKLERDREIHAEDLPSGVTPEDVLRARQTYFEKPSRPVLDALTDELHRCSVVLGDPGSGKSTLSRYILLSLISDDGDERLRRAFEGHLPLLIELRSYAGLCNDIKGSTFLDFIEFLSRNEGWDLDRAALENYLKADGRAVVVFDGLDEIFNPDEREQIARRIAGFASLYPNSRVIVTSRVIGYRRKILTDEGFSHFTLQDLDEGQVEQFIERWYALALNERPEEGKARRERIMRSFKESPSIRQLAGNPMLLTIMAIIGKNQELPRERWKLYDHAAGVLIYHWDVERHLRDQRINAPFIGEDEKKELLRRLAYKMQSGEGGLAGNYIHRDDLQREFEGYLRERFAQSPADATTIARAMIEQFRERNFILSLHGANLYGYVHRAFLEYFCASDFVQKFNVTHEMDIDALKAVYGAHWEDRSWHEVLRLICGMISEKFAGELIDHLNVGLNLPLPESFAEKFPYNISLAVQCLSELRNYGMVAEPATRLLTAVCSLLEHWHRLHKSSLSAQEDWLARIRETSFFGLYYQHIYPYCQLIGADWPGRVLLADWLGGLRASFASKLSDIFDQIVPLTVGMFVGAVGAGEEAIYSVLLGYANSSNAGDRLTASYAFLYGWGALPETFTFLGEMALNDQDSQVRTVAVETLAGHFKASPKALDIILDRAVNDPSPESDALIRGVRPAALNSLANGWPSDPRVLPLLRERESNDPVETVRRTAKALADKLEQEQQSQTVSEESPPSGG